MKKEELVATRLPRNLVLDLKKIESAEQSDRSTVLRKLLYREVTDWKKEYSARLYAEGKVTLEKAALDSGSSVREMMEYLKTRKIPAQYDAEDLEEDMKSFYRRMGRWHVISDNEGRLLRKKGVGIILVSQKVSDFDPAMRSAVNTSALFRTKYEGDLDSISRSLKSWLFPLACRIDTHQPQCSYRL